MIDLLVRIILVVPPASLIGAWVVSQGDDRYSFDFLAVASGQLWWAFLLWPLAVLYFLLKRYKSDDLPD